MAPTDEQRELAAMDGRVFADMASMRELTTGWVEQPPPLDGRRWATLARVGLTGISAPESAGGGGAGLLELTTVVEQAGYALPALPFVPATIAALILVQSASPAAAVTLSSVAASAGVTVPARETCPAFLVPRRRDTVWLSQRGTLDGVLRSVPFGVHADSCSRPEQRWPPPCRRLRAPRQTRSSSTAASGSPSSTPPTFSTNTHVRAAFCSARKLNRSIGSRTLFWLDRWFPPASPFHHTRGLPTSMATT